LATALLSCTSETCYTCKSQAGRVEKVKLITLAGIDEKQLVRVWGMGNLGPGGPGDCLYVRTSALIGISTAKAII
jgi:DnaJ-class molecular chaperone